jgi:hypothetical protein
MALGIPDADAILLLETEIAARLLPRGARAKAQAAQPSLFD